MGEWTHINGLRRVADGGIQDNVLRRLLHCAVPTGGDESDLEENTAGSRLNKLLAASDLDNIMAVDGAPPSVRDVPGGTISFLFEKVSNSNLDSGAEIDGDYLQ